MQLIKLKNVVRMKGKFIPAVLFFGLFYLILPYLYNLYGQDARDSGFKYFKNYNYKEYNHQQQNWGMVQAPDGIIYVANQGGILEYDGVTWRVIDVPNNMVRSLTIDKEGTIFIGGYNEIGYLTPDEKGTLKYKSLRSLLPADQIEFGDVWKTYASEKGIYFHTSKQLFRWDNQKKVMKIWEPRTQFYFS